MALDLTANEQIVPAGLAKVRFPKALLASFGSDDTIVSIKNINDNVYAAAAPMTAVGSSIVAIDVTNGADGTTPKSVTNATDNITITLPVTAGIPVKNLTCAFWNTTSGMWDISGMST